MTLTKRLVCQNFISKMDGTNHVLYCSLSIECFVLFNGGHGGSSTSGVFLIRASAFKIHIPLRFHRKVLHIPFFVAVY